MANTSFSNLKELLSNSNNIFLGKGKLTYSDPSGKLSGKDEDVTIFIFAHDKVRQNVVFIKDEITLLYKASIDEHALADIKSALKLLGQEPAGTLIIKDDFKVTLTKDCNEFVSSKDFRSLSKKQLEDVCNMLSIDIDKSFKYTDISLSNKNGLVETKFQYTCDTNPEHEALLPYMTVTNDSTFVFNKQHKLVASYIEQGFNVLITGLPGSGKTEFLKALGNYFNKEIILIPCDSGTLPSTFTGEFQPNSSPIKASLSRIKKAIDYVLGKHKDDEVIVYNPHTFEFKKSRFCEAYNKNAIIILDEVNRIPLDSQSALLPALDGSACLVLPTGEVVNRAVDTRIVATANVNQKGVQGMTEALKNRFTKIVEFDSLLQSFPNDKKRDAEALNHLIQVMDVTFHCENKKLMEQLAILSREVFKVQFDNYQRDLASFRNVISFYTSAHKPGTGELTGDTEFHFRTAFLNMCDDTSLREEMFKSLKPLLDDYIKVASAKTEADIGTYNSPISSLDSKADDIVNNILNDLDDITPGGTL